MQLGLYKVYVRRCPDPDGKSGYFETSTNHYIVPLGEEIQFREQFELAMKRKEISDCKITEIATFKNINQILDFASEIVDFAENVGVFRMNFDQKKKVD